MTPEDLAAIRAMPIPHDDGPGDTWAETAWALADALEQAWAERNAMRHTSSEGHWRCNPCYVSVKAGTHKFVSPHAEAVPVKLARELAELRERAERAEAAGCVCHTIRAAIEGTE